MTLIQNKKLTLLLGASLALATILFALFALDRADPASAGPAIPTTISTAQSAAFSALRQPAASGVPAEVATWADSPSVAKFGPNAALARAVVPPNGSATDPWYIIPGNGNVCLWADGATTCTTTEKAAASGVSLQLIEPNQESTTSPLPPPGAAVVSTVIGIAPDGVKSVQTVTKAGADQVKAPAGNGTFAITGTDIQQVALAGGAQGSSATIDVYHR